METGKAQAVDFEKTYLFDRDRDHMIPLPVSDASDNYLIAGTAGKSKGDISLMRVKGDGTVVFSKIIRRNGFEKTVVDFTEMNGYFYITALQREIPYLTSLDLIEVIGVDASGNIISDETISSTINENFYPIHTISENNTLYICGYVVNNLTTNLVVTTTNKQGLIVAYVPGAAPIASFFDIGNGSAADYDMAVNARFINGDLYVTGACNAMHATSPFGGTSFTSGSFVSRLDVALNPNGATNCYTMQYGSDYQWAEHGFDLYLNTNNNVLYLLGNYYQGYGCSSACIDDVRPAFLQITALNINTLDLYNTNGILDRWQFGGFDYLWGLQTLRSTNGIGNILVSGMLTNTDASCMYQYYPSTPALLPSFDNYNPYIMDLNLDWDATVDTIMVHPNFTKTYMSRVGTGTSSLSNSYHAISDWMYNNTWSANNICLRSSNSSNTRLALTAPVWNQYNNKLNFKTIQTDAIGNLSVCTDVYTECLSPDIMNYAENVTTSQAPQWNPYPTITSNNNSYTEYTDNPQTLDCSTGYYRVTQIPEATAVKLSPNPASDHIKLNFNGKVTNLSVLLSDLTGRTVSKLFDGTIEGNDLTLQLPSLANGLYLVSIELNGKHLPSQKLIINH